MKKDSRIDNKIKKMDFILEKLQRGEKLSVNSIFNLFNGAISKRTCERYIADLQDRYQGKILRGEKSKYFWSGEVNVKPFYMEMKDFWYIYMAVLSFNSYGLDEKLKDEIIDKLEDLILPKEAEVYREAKENILVKRKGVVVYENESLITIFIKLINHFSERNVLLLKYRNKEGGIKEYKINIYGFCRAKDSYYIVVKLYEYISFLRIDRIVNFSYMYEKYEIEKDFNLKEYMKDAFEIEVTKNIIEFKLEVFESAKVNVLERNWFENQKIEKKDGKIFFSARTNSEKELKKWILGFGAGVKVLEPESLKKEILNEYKKAINIY